MGHSETLLGGITRFLLIHILVILLLFYGIITPFTAEALGTALAIEAVPQHGSLTAAGEPRRAGIFH